MTAAWRAADGSLIQLQIEPGDAQGDERRLVHGLPSAVMDALTAITAHLVSLKGYTDNLETLAGATNTALATLAGYNDGLEDKLDQLLALSPTTGVTNQTTVGTTSAAFGSQACAVGVWIKNISTSSQKVCIKQNAVATLTNGWLMSVGDAEHFFPCTNMDQLQHIASAVSGQVSWHAI